MLEVRDVGKRFQAIEALSHVTLEVERGHVHALVGENGAGKSTLGKIIGGVLAPDAGSLALDGKRVAWRSPHEALAHGITTITQEIALLGRQTVLENVFAGLEKSRFGWLDRRGTRRAYDDLVARFHVELPPDARVADLSIANQKKVEVLQALARRAQLIVMDEPTAPLSDQETEAFLEVVRQLRGLGTTIIYVSHFLDEVLDIADAVTVMRNGRVVRTGPTAEETRESLVTAMLGKTLQQLFPATTPADPSAPSVLGARDLGYRGWLDGITFDVRAGEILGIAGLVGSGRSRLARTLFGAEPHDRGDILVDGEPRRIRSVSEAISAGIAMLPESRKDQGLTLKQSMGDNLTLPHLPAVSRFGLLRHGKERDLIRKAIEAVDVRPPTPSLGIRYLSGGNQQKVLFGKWLLQTPKVLIVDEPTRGIDIGAKQAIYQLLVDLCAQGIAVLMVSSEIEEILGLAHRILVMREGRIVGAFDNTPGLTSEDVMRTAFTAPGASPPRAGDGSKGAPA